MELLKLAMVGFTLLGSAVASVAIIAFVYAGKSGNHRHRARLMYALAMGLAPGLAYLLVFGSRSGQVMAKEHIPILATSLLFISLLMLAASFLKGHVFGSGGALGAFPVAVGAGVFLVIFVAPESMVFPSRIIFGALMTLAIMVLYRIFDGIAAFFIRSKDRKMSDL